MLPERWTMLVENPPEIDESTSNRIPVPPTEVPWTGLLQERFPQTTQDEFADGHVKSELILLLDPGITPMPDRRSIFRDDNGERYVVHGNPKVRRPARGSRRPAYIAATVRHASDMR